MYIRAHKTYNDSILESQRYWYQLAFSFVFHLWPSTLTSNIYRLRRCILIFLAIARLIKNIQIEFFFENHYWYFFNHTNWQIWFCFEYQYEVLCKKNYQPNLVICSFKSKKRTHINTTICDDFFIFSEFCVDFYILYDFVIGMAKWVCIYTFFAAQSPYK